MFAYFVILKIMCGEYEKITHHLLATSNEEEAAKQALLNECHSELGEGAEWLEEGQQIEDLYGQMIYTLYSVEPVNSEEYATLKNFM